MLLSARHRANFSERESSTLLSHVMSSLSLQYVFAQLRHHFPRLFWEAFLGLTYLEVGLAMIAALLVLSVLRWWFRREPLETKHAVTVQCACGWRGRSVSRRRRCPQCGATM